VLALNRFPLTRFAPAATGTHRPFMAHPPANQLPVWLTKDIGPFRDADLSP
jgi:hypothetical protein